MITYATLFIVSFISATLLPLGSEAFMVYNVSLGYDIFIVWLVASVGNIGGAVFNYYLGLKGEEYLDKKGYIDKVGFTRYKSFFVRYGSWMILCAWMPIIGDPITFVAGVLRYRFSLFVLLVSISKSFRYAILLMIYQGYF